MKRNVDVSGVPVMLEKERESESPSSMATILGRRMPSTPPSALDARRLATQPLHRIHLLSIDLALPTATAAGSTWAITASFAQFSQASKSDDELVQKGHPDCLVLQCDIRAAVFNASLSKRRKIASTRMNGEMT